MLNKPLPRLLQLPQNHSFFLFGARGTGKSTLLKTRFKSEESLNIDLLDPMTEDRFARHPEELASMVMALSTSPIRHVIIDEIQKVPRLLDVVHHLIETTPFHFVMTGSSPRKLKRGGANLLAGRAFVYHLFPFSFSECQKYFDLDDTLRWGLLPKIYSLSSEKEKIAFLQAYAHTYLKEEIWAEQIVKKLDPFRRFLEVSAQANGKIINYANIAQDVGVDSKTIKSYFSILEDSLIGFFLEPFHNSFRKRLLTKPKFYYFDPGVVRALSRYLSVPLKQSTSAYGEAFEHLVILEAIKWADYQQNEFRFSYLQTKDEAEIDLVVERPGQPLLLIEIKSKTQVLERDLSAFSRLTRDFHDAERVCFSQDPMKKKIGEITVYPWQEGIVHFFGPTKQSCFIRSDP